MLRQLLEQVDKYLKHRASVKEFEAWLIANLQTILDSRDDSIIGLANQMDADLVELGEGLIDEPAFRSRLSRTVIEAVDFKRG